MTRLETVRPAAPPPRGTGLARYITVLTYALTKARTRLLAPAVITALYVLSSQSLTQP